jgi:hypothetical protein
MPAKGYRKGVHDSRVPAPKTARTRLSDGLHALLITDAARRRLTLSKLISAVLEHHYRNRPMPRVKAAAASGAVIHELNRIGVNLNQLTHLANASRQISKERLDEVLTRIETTIERL